jgi:tight adherence protein C
MTWKKLSWLSSALALLTCLLPASPARAADGRVEVLEVRDDAYPRVSVRLNAFDADGLPLEGLTPQHVEVVENGQPQSSADVRPIHNPALPTSVMLAIDVSGSMADEDKLAQAQAAAKSFLDLMRRRDAIGVVSFGDGISVPQPLTSDRKLLTKAIDAFAAGGQTRLYDGLAQSLTQLSIAPRAARAVVLLTDGRDTGSERGIPDNVRQAVSSGVPVYAIGLGADVDSDVLQRLARETGGRYYAAPTGEDLTQVFRLISRQLTSQYEVSWISSSQSAPGADVSVQISLQQPGTSTVQVSVLYQQPFFRRLERELPDNPSSELTEVAAVTAPDQRRAVLAGLLAGGAAFALLVGLTRGRGNRRLDARLSTFVAGKPATPFRAGGSVLAVRRAGVNPITSIAARLAARLLPARQIQRLRRKLGQAGHSSERHLMVFLATEVALALVLGSAAYSLLQLRGLGDRSPLLPFLIAGMVAVLGLYIPYMWLRRRVEWRRRALLGALPDALDLMAIAVSAGLSLDSAMQEVVQKWDGELSRELGQVLNEMQLGASRREALQNLADRTQLDDFRLLVAALLQADELGANLSETLAVQAVQLRIRRRQLAEEKARKAPIKMLIPLVLLIFPAMFVVLLAPAVLQFMIALGRMTGRG